jgi:hypothetical protein
LGASFLSDESAMLALALVPGAALTGDLGIDR